jgi:TolB-like protein/DNA-binding winged helix-turn-helix (wHTH) protein/Tfp pilus assembly protein PilF
MARQTKHFFEFGAFRLDLQAHRLIRDGASVLLPPKAMEALLVLLRHGGELMKREELMQAVWGDTFVEDANLTVAISQLRKALGQNGETAEYIETIPRVGYRFVAEVRETYEEPRPLIIEKHTQSRTVIEEEVVSDHKDERVAIPVTLPSQSVSIRSVNLGSRTMKLLVALGVVILTASALVAYRELKSRSDPGVESGTIRSVAVLPLKNLTGDPENEYLSDGLTEGLINDLARIEGLKVISRGSVFGLKGKDIDPRDAGKQLGVTTVLEGSVVKSKDLARVALRLVSAEDGRVLWSGDSAEHSLGDVFAFQDELARSVSNSLRPKLGRKEAIQIAKHYTDNQEAYQLYLKGRYFWNKRTAPDLDRAIHYLEQAINLDPGYALAYSGLADSYALLSYFSNRPFEETFPKARAAAEKALEIDNSLAEPHATLGLVIPSLDWDWARGEAEFKRALELNPNYATAHHWYGWYLINVGRQGESVREMERALELDPFSIEINVDLGAVLTYAHRPDEAIKRFQMALEMDQNFIEAHWGLGLAYQRKGEHERAIIELEKARDLSEGRRPDILAELGRSYALTGNKSKALAVITRLKALPKETNISSYHLAKVYLGLGEKDKALTALEAAFQARSSQVIGLKCEPAFDELRGEPRFQKILASVGLA